MEASTAEIVSAVANGITAAMAIGTLYVASQGLDLWREQLIGEDEYTVAKKAIRMLLQAKSLTGNLDFEFAISDDKFCCSDELRHEYHKLNRLLSEVCEESTIAWGADWTAKNFGPVSHNLFLMRSSEMVLKNAKIDREQLAKSQKQFIDELIDRLRRFVRPSHSESGRHP